MFKVQIRFLSSPAWSGFGSQKMPAENYNLPLLIPAFGDVLFPRYHLFCD